MRRILDATACGKAIYEWDSCLKAACPADTCTDAKTCYAKARSGACKAVDSNVATACPKIADTEATCGNLVSAIIEACAGGVGAGVN